jgi:two-component system sensor histidine kinase VanS
VENTGEPLDPELVTRRAEPFLRRRRAHSQHHVGVGLGLAIVKRITQAHDGTLALSPRAEGGSASWCNYPSRLCASVPGIDRTTPAPDGASLV